MPTINKPFLLRLVLVIAVLTGLLFGAHAIQAGRIPEALRRQADRAADGEKPDLAIHYLRQYLEFAPDDVEAQIQLAELMRKRNPTARGQTEVIFIYERILRLDPKQDGIRRDALAACVKAARFSDAVTHAEALIATYPTEAALWQELGAAQAGLHQLAEARNAYETAIKHDPQQMRGYQRLAQLAWREMNDPAAAREVLDRMTKALPGSPEAHLVRARFEGFLAEEGGSAVPADLNRAGVELRRVLELDPEHAEASLLLAELFQRQRKIPAAHAVLRDAATLYPRDLQIVRSLSWLEVVRGNTPAAIAVLDDALKVNPDALDLLVPLADLLAQQGDSARTTEIVRRLESRPAAGNQRRLSPAAQQAQATQVKYLKARLAMRDRQWPEATALLEALRREVTNNATFENQLNLLLASCAIQVADRPAEQQAYQRVLLADPKNVQARVGLGNLYLGTGKFEDAVKELEAAALSPYAPGSVVVHYVHTKARWLHSTGGSPEQWRRLEQVLNESRGRFAPASSEPVILSAEIGTALGKTAEVVQLLRRESASRPGDTRLWGVLAEAVADLRGTSAGLAVVDEAQSAAGDGPDVRLTRARLYADEPGRVRPIGPLMERIESWPETEQLRLLGGMVEVFDHVGDQAGVVRALRAIANRRPSDVAIWVRLHERALRTGDGKSAAEARTALVKIEGEAGQSVLLCDAAAATPAEAAAVLGRLTAAFGPNPVRADACLARSRLLSLAGDEAEAARLTERAFSLEPTRYEAAREWLLHLCGGDEQRARQLVARLATDPRWAGDPFRRLVGALVPRVQPPVAANLLAWARPHVERDPGGLRWLAETAMMAGPQVIDPRPILEAAVARKGATVDDWLRLALARKPEDLNGARGKVSPADFFGAVAVVLETPAGKDYRPELRTPVEKRTLAQARLGVKLSRNRPQEAAKLLEAYLADGDVPKGDEAWCRRNLAMLYAVGGTLEDRKRAMGLITTVDDAGTSAEELRATASVLTTLARYLEGADRVRVLTRAAVALGEAHKKGQASQDLYNLSQLYRAAGNRVESRKCLQALLKAELDPNNTKPKNIYYLTAALDELVESREFEAGAGFAKLLLHDHAGEFLAVASVARYEAKAGRPEAALAVAEGYARAANVSAGDHLTRSGRVAELLDELARLPGVRGTPTARAITDAAVERYESLVPTRAEAVVGVVGLLAADGRSREAFGRIDHFGRYMPARVRAAAGLAILRAGGVTEEQAATVLEWLDACLREDPESSALRMNRAEYLAQRLDLSGAAAEYEKVCEREPRNVVALNNLAWILAADPATAERALELVTRATREVGLTGDLLDTRARVRITLKQFAEAERDLNDAIRLEPTPLRWFHLALSRLGQTPPKTDDATKAFAEALRRGLEQRNVHPADRGAFDSLKAGTK